MTAKTIFRGLLAVLKLMLSAIGAALSALGYILEAAAQEEPDVQYDHSGVPKGKTISGTEPIAFDDQGSTVGGFSGDPIIRL